MQNFWDFLKEKLENQFSVVLLVVVSAQGSTPGRQGFRMLISEDDEQFGTIGGGVMEMNFINIAKNILQSNNETKFYLKKQVHHKFAPEEEQSGLICSGEEQICYGLLQPNEHTITLCKQILTPNSSGRYLTITPHSISIIGSQETATSQKKYDFVFENESEWCFYEDLSLINRLYIFGAGHVGLALAHVFSLLDFHIVIFDNRPNLHTLKKNSFANKIVIDNYGKAGNYIEEGNSSYIAVVTTSMPTDVEVLESLVHKNVRYIGLMGSRSKRREVFMRLKNKGITEEHLNKIRCPIGLEGLKTHTAEEIAISIAAEILMVQKN